jgi:hypothetical protein
LHKESVRAWRGQLQCMRSNLCTFESGSLSSLTRCPYYVYHPLAACVGATVSTAPASSLSRARSRRALWKRRCSKRKQLHSITMIFGTAISAHGCIVPKQPHTASHPLSTAIGACGCAVACCCRAVYHRRLHLTQRPNSVRFYWQRVPARSISTMGARALKPKLLHA